jgi:hypothetical protein
LRIRPNAQADGDRTAEHASKLDKEGRPLCHDSVMRTRVATIVFGGLVVLSATSMSPATVARAITAPRSRPRVTLISDSVAGAIWFDTGAKATLAQGIDLFLEPGEARRLGGDTAPGEIAPPTALQLIAMLGHRLGPTVIMCIGYNDVPSQYAQNLEAALDALRGAGVTRVLWTTLEVTPAHLGNAVINDAIEVAAAHHPEVSVVDWSTYASNHPEWFQPNGDVHLTGDGPRAIARLFHASLVTLGIPSRR